MNRFAAFFLAALVALVVACNVDRIPSSNGIEKMSPAVENLVATYNFFKVQDKNSTWRCLDLIGDTLKVNNANGYNWRSNGTGGSSTDPTFFKVDTVGFDANPESGQWHFYPSVSHSYGYMFSYNTATAFGSQLLLRYDSVGTAGTWWTAFDGMASLSLSAQQLVADANGAFQFGSATTSPTCTITAPTSVVLANNGPFNWKVTWSNNGNTTDQTEVWFGTDPNETLQATVSATQTSYTGSFPGHGLFYSYLRKVRPGIQSARVYSGSLTH